MLNIENVCKKFNDKKIIDNVSFSAKNGEIALFLGASGVGKSTLLRILNNLETPDSGTFTLDGKSLDLSTVNKTHTIGFVFQHFNLFDHLTVEENITLPLELAAGKTKKEAHETAHKLLAHYSLADKAHVYPSSLSGGQKQRLALARTLALKPRVICLDEPTSALDPVLTASVAQTIQDLAHQGYIVLIATHDTSLLKRLSCTIYLMKEGRIHEYGPSADVAAHPEKYPAINQFIQGH